MNESSFIIASAKLARSSPHEWDEFLKSLEAYTTALKDQCISSPLDVLQVNQGRAQQAVAFLRLFRECVNRADQITEKRK